MSDLTLLTGQFGLIKVIQKGSNLQINDGSPNGPRNLQPINRHTFFDGDVILQFKQEENKKPSALLCTFPNGQNASFEALKSTAKIAQTMGIPADSLTSNETPDNNSAEEAATESATSTQKTPTVNIPVDATHKHKL